MNLIGRYERVRSYGYDGISPPYIIDRKWNQLKPAAGSEWWRSPEGVWLPVPRGGVGMSGAYTATGQVLGIPEAGSISVVDFALNSAYTAGSAGDATATRFIVPQAETLTDWYVWIDGFVGTAANVNDLLLELRTNSTYNPDTGGGGLLDSKTFDPASTTGWHKITGWSQVLTAGATYWMVVADPDGSASDYANIGLHFLLDDDITAFSGPWMPARTTNGWTGVPTLFDERALAVGAFSSGRVMGRPFANVSQTSTTLQRGLYIDGLTGSAKIYGLWFGAATNNLTQINIWEETDGPSGTPFASTTNFFRNVSRVLTGGIFTDFVTLSASTPYRFVMQQSPASNSIRKLQISAGVDANLRKAMPGKGNWFWTEESGGSWSDDQDGFPQLGVLVEDFL